MTAPFEMSLTIIFHNTFFFPAATYSSQVLNMYYHMHKSQLLPVGSRSLYILVSKANCVALFFTIECPLGLVGATGCIIFLEIRPLKYTLVINN